MLSPCTIFVLAMKRNRITLGIIAVLLCSINTSAQNILTPQNERQISWADTDSTEKEDVPTGFYMWNIDERFGDIRPTTPDTLLHGFPNSNFTEGGTFRYNTLGNLGSPRQSRIFYDRWEQGGGNQFIFERPYDFFIKQPSGLVFTNTKSPITNITYQKCGNKTNGEDRINALFAVNAGKRLGMGFRLDYLYGRGYYPSQSTSQFGGTVFGSYLGERYKMHIAYSANHLKTAENGGLESDLYITDPQSFPEKYGTADMPTRLSKTWNRLNVNYLYLTHRYDVGFLRYTDSEGNVVKRESKNKLNLPGVEMNADSITAQTDSIATDTLELKSTFVPVAGFLHTLRVDHNNRRLVSNALLDNYYADYYLPGDSANDFTKNIYVTNTLAFELREGFNRWVKSGMRLFARHEFNRFTLPDESKKATTYNYNYFTVGAQLMKEQGKIFHYNVLGELRTTGADWGEFNVEGNISFNIPLRRDSLQIKAEGYIRNESPLFYYNHYHGRNAWWDNDFKKVMRSRIGGTLRYRDTRLCVFMETLQNYLYFQEQQSPYTSSAGTPLAHFGVTPRQHNKNIQLLGATLRQDCHWGIFNWENELTYQATSDKDVLPLPAFNAYTNIYLSFKVAKVLTTEIGADMRYFTRYYAPAYSPIIGQFCVQDPEQRVKIGNYPFINVYANLHLRNFRFYVMGSHINRSGKGGNYFITPHYPANGLVIRLGLSWNFYN